MNCLIGARDKAMKIVKASISRPLRRGLCTGLLLGIAALGRMPTRAQAQLFYVSLPGSNTVGEYSAAGAAINANLITTGLNAPIWMAVSGDTLFVANTADGTIGTYNATTGAPINANFITGAGGGLAVSGNTLFVVCGGRSTGSGTVGEYDASTGAVINANFVTGLTAPRTIAVSGNTLLVTCNGSGPPGSTLSGIVSAYDANTGAVINANFIKGLSNPQGLAVSGNNLFVADAGTDTISEYDANTGRVINAKFITGVRADGVIQFSVPIGIAVSGDDLLVANNVANGTVGRYNAITGALIDAHFITGLNRPTGLAVGSADCGCWPL
jgi:WD40 repeat protein